jgi:hypothetical protein
MAAGAGARDEEERVSFYQRLISETLHCTEEEAVEVEDVMRHDIFHSTLDWQTRESLQQAAREAYKMIRNQQSGNQPQEDAI